MNIHNIKQNIVNITIIFVASALLLIYTVVSHADSSIQKNVEIIVDSNDHQHFKDAKRRCSYYWPYYAGKITKPNGQLLRKIECRRYADLITLANGYAPHGVFFRSKIGRPRSEIQSYNWKIRGPITNESKPLLAEHDSFNAAMVFEKAGKYEASVQVTFKDGTRAEDSIAINIWPRDKKTYYVDAKVGDDRFEGLSKEPDNSCSPDKNPIGACNGPWKTATRAFSILAPRDWRKKASKKYSANSVCQSYVTKKITRYPDGDYSLYKNSKTALAGAIQNSNGDFLEQHTTKICTKLAPIKKTILEPGVQILFNRGQSYEFETGVSIVKKYKKERNGKIDKYEKINCESLVSVGHWSSSLGIHFGAYGDGSKPKINNSGQSSCTAFYFLGVGLMHLSFQDLHFNLQSPSDQQHNNRASFLFAVGHPINLVLNRTNIEQFNQGALFHNAHGVFINRSRFHDSKVVHLYSETATDVAFLNNKFDYSGNHIAYTNMSNGLILGNTFNRHAFGRTALRIFGSGSEFITKSIWVSGNHFEGWIDPRTTAECLLAARCPYVGGKRYNYSLVELHPNDPSKDRFSEDIVFTRNTLKNAENLLRVGAVHNLTISDNTFDTDDNSNVPLVKLHSSLSRRPLKNINIHKNRFIKRSTNKTKQQPIIELSEHSNNLDNHQSINITNNDFSKTISNCIISAKNQKTNQNDCLLSRTDTRSQSSQNKKRDITIRGNDL